MVPTFCLPVIDRNSKDQFRTKDAVKMPVKLSVVHGRSPSMASSNFTEHFSPSLSFLLAMLGIVTPFEMQNSLVLIHISKTLK